MLKKKTKSLYPIPNKKYKNIFEKIVTIKAFYSIVTVKIGSFNTHRTSLTKARAGAAALWWCATRGRQTPVMIVQSETPFRLRMDENLRLTEEIKESVSDSRLLSTHSPWDTSCCHSCGHMTSCFAGRPQQAAEMRDAGRVVRSFCTLIVWLPTTRRKDWNDDEYKLE